MTKKKKKRKCKFCPVITVKNLLSCLRDLRKKEFKEPGVS